MIELDQMTDEHRKRLNALLDKLQYGELDGKSMSPSEQVDAVFYLGITCGAEMKQDEQTNAASQGRG